LTIAEGAIRPWGRKMAGTSKFLEDLSKLGIDINKPYQKLSKEKKEIVLYGKGDYPGAVNHLEERYLKTDSDNIRAQIEEYLVEKVCPSCQGRRLRKLALNVLIEDKSIADLNNLDIKSLKDFFDNFEPQTSYGSKIVDQINDRIDFLLKVGLDYLSLSRSSDSLAGGEAQRVRLATQLGSALSGVIYILDEPTIGLHPSDLEPLLKVVSNLKKNDSTVVMVEHDKETIKAADYIIDLGPGAGRQGGEIVAQGTYQQVKNSNSLTGEYLRGEKRIEIPIRRRKAKKYLEIIGASYRNLKNIDVKIPLGNLVCISGVSGSGKSTLLYDILGKALSKYFYNAKAKPGEHREIKGLNNIDKVIKVNQAPIGRTPRSNPATYVGIFSLIRKEFAETDLAKEREYDAAQFSFNVKKGRCSKCAGQGQKKIEMYFMDDVYVPCPKCQGQRYNSQTLEVELNGKNIAQVLEMTVDQARDFFTAFPKLRRKLEVLQDVGLGYLELGQPATTLSGGEAQRIKLAKELSRKSYNQTLYILDEPTTGLHLDDINRLLKVLNKLVDRGNTVVVIEHNSEVLKAADHIIDLGPGGGEQGGEIVAQGTPEELTENNRSLTGRYIKKALDESK
jgi:excinuclease ABC subunit A